MVRSPIRALGTYGELVVYGRPSAFGTALTLLNTELAAIDLACSRFRCDSELMRVNARSGQRLAVSPVLAQAVAVAVRAATQTAGDVVPTLGASLVAAGYDGDFRTLAIEGPAVSTRPPAGAWQDIEVDCDENTVRVPPGVALDLGATAKALAADRASHAIATATGAGVLVNLGGDLSMAGPPPESGWPVRVTDRPVVGPASATPDTASAAAITTASLIGTACPDDALAGQIVHLHGGGLATSSTAVRRWQRGGTAYHHILDPRAGTPVEPVWRIVTVAAGSCVEANTASTASIIRGEAALDWLRELRLPSVLVSATGAVHRVAGWPEPPA